ncbi:MAG: Phosphoserine phosphatase rsbX [Nitrospira sp.]|nr:MAG: Phosphoserine phosphatase rsbX [Nitrospira sp.]
MLREDAAGDQVQIPVGESTRVAEARRKAVELAGRIGLDETKTGACAVIASEMGTNLVKHATDGEMFLRHVTQGAMRGIELVAIDRGPGIANVNHALKDGMSTAGSSGNGLGAMVRMAAEFDIHSLPGRGTSLVARIWNGAVPARLASGMKTGVIQTAKPGETVSGDAWHSECTGNRTLCAVVDGLGHGALAAQAAQVAVETLRTHAGAPLTEQVDLAHRALRPTRGVALGIAEILHDQELVKFVGIGNIMASIWQAGSTRSMVSQNGILGHQIRRVMEFHYPWSESAILVMCSDGINTHWDLNPYTGLTARDPSLIAATLYRDFSRGRDDATVVILKRSKVEGYLEDSHLTRRG